MSTSIPASGVHAQVVPLALARLFTGPLAYSGGSVDPFELISWTKPPLTADERDGLRRDALLRLRPKGRVVEASCIGVKVPDSAAWRLHGADAQALADLLRALAVRDLDSVTFGAAAMVWPGRSESLWRLLAIVEALDWTPPPYSEEWAPRRALITAGQRTEKRLAAAKLRESSALRPLSTFDSSDLSEDEFRAFGQLAWVASVSKGDMRLSQSATLCSQIGKMDLDALNRTIGAPALARRLIEMDHLSLLEELREVFRCMVLATLTRPTPTQVTQWMGILEARYLSPEGAGRTLEEVGQLFQLTRERARQICDRALTIGLTGPVVLPVLERELARARRAAPAKVAEVNKGLAGSGAAQIGIEALINVARLLGTRVDIDIQEVRLRLDGELSTVSMVQHADSMESGWPRRAIALARGSVGFIGCASIVYVAGMMVLEGEPPPDAGALEGALEAVPGFKWLDRSKTWFVFGESGAESAIARRVRKLLAVAQYEPRTDEVLEALVTDDLVLYRDNKRLSFPPLHILREVLATWPWVRLLQFNRVGTLEPVGLDVLEPPERVIYDVIQAHNGFALTHEIEQAVMERSDVSRVRVHQMLGTSPILRRCEHAMYTLAARPVNLEGLESARRRQLARSGRSAVTDTESVILITAGCLRNGQVTAPAWLEGRFPTGLIPVEGSDVQLKVGAQNQLRGFRRLVPNARAGDSMRIEWVPEGAVRVTLLRAGDEGIQKALPPAVDPVA